MKNQWEIQVWHAGHWETDTWWASEFDATSEFEFMQSHGFVVRVIVTEVEEN
jgi:hypothetical protein